MEEEKNFCRECCREITKSEAEFNNGLCKYCYQVFKVSNENNKSSNDNIYSDEETIKSNPIAVIIKFIAIIGGIIGSIYGFSLLDSIRSEEMAIPMIIISIISAIFIYALGEIIQLLEDIKNK